jgi:ferredoxin
MSISRKEFFRQSLFSLGKTALDIADTLKGRIPIIQVEPQGATPLSEARPDMYADAFNERCLARSGICSNCVESCKPEAIKIIPGVGIRINPQLCNGCGACEYVCPVEPKAVVVIPK